MIMKSRKNKNYVELCLFILLVIFAIIILYMLRENTRNLEHIKETEKVIEKKENEIIRLKSDSARLELQLKEKDIHIKLDIQGIPPRIGGGVVLNNIQGN